MTEQAKLLDADEVRARLAAACKPNRAEWARDNNMSDTYVADVLAKRREPAGKVLRALGLRRVTGYLPS